MLYGGEKKKRRGGGKAPFTAFIVNINNLSKLLRRISLLWLPYNEQLFRFEIALQQCCVVHNAIVCWLCIDMSYVEYYHTSQRIILVLE